MNMFFNMKARLQGLAVAGTLLASYSFYALPAQAGVIAQCGEPVCAANFSIFFEGMPNEAGGGEFLYDATSGEITLNTDAESIRGNGMLTPSGTLMWTMGDGSQVRVSSVYGNADPILGFSLGATTTGTGRSFAFAFDLPIALDGPIEARSSVSYSLTSTTSAGAQITPLNSHVVTANEVDTTVGGIGVLNKGVDVGDAFFFTGGPQTQNSSVFTASNSFTGDIAYDLMSVQVAFALSADSAVGLSGFVEQTPVPIPAALPLFFFGLTGLGVLARMKKRALRV